MIFSKSSNTYFSGKYSAQMWADALSGDPIFAAYTFTVEPVPSA
jgi:hypothetical protein